LTRPRSLLEAGVAALVLLSAATASADEPPGDDDDDEPPHEDPAFHYTIPTRPNYLRAAIEQAIVLGVGFLQYSLDKSNAVDWDLSYDWPSMRSKLVFESVTFDNNRFPTNWLTHPLAGVAYYTTARSNRVGVLPSFAMAVGSSALWEYVGEWKEQVSINDAINTPVAGLALGEPLLQIGALMHRSRPTTATRAFGWIFAPIKSLHDTLDGLTPEQAESVDDLGLPADEYHRFRVGTSVGITHQERGLTQGDGRVRLDARVVSLRDYEHDGLRDGWFDSGEVSDLFFNLATSEGKVVDFTLAASTMPIAIAGRASGPTASAASAGAPFSGGLEIGIEYSTHDYNRDRPNSVDHIALVAGGPSFEEILFLGGGARLRGRLDLLANFGGIDAYALSEYRRDYGDLRLTSVLRNQRYYHGYGGTFRPSIALDAGRIDAGADFPRRLLRLHHGPRCRARCTRPRVARARPTHAVTRLDWLRADEAHAHLAERRASPSCGIDAGRTQLTLRARHVLRRRPRLLASPLRPERASHHVAREGDAYSGIIASACAEQVPFTVTRCSYLAGIVDRDG
jgi:hypothetical protein